MARTHLALGCALLAAGLALAGPAGAQDRSVTVGNRTYALHFPQELRLVRDTGGADANRTAAWDFETADWRLDDRGKFGVTLGIIESADSFGTAAGFYRQSYPGLAVSVSDATLFVDGEGFHIFLAPSRCPYPCSVTIVLGYDPTHAALGERTAELVKADLSRGDFVHVKE